MPQATAYSVVKRALTDGLNARPGLQGVTVDYAAPERIPDLKADGGAFENIHFTTTADGDVDNVVFCGPALVFDEDYVQGLKIQVLMPGSLGTQEQCDLRVGELLYEVWAFLAGQSAWDLEAMGLGFLDNLIVTPTSQEWSGGRLGGTVEGHAGAVEIGLQVEARRSP